MAASHRPDTRRILWRSLTSTAMVVDAGRARAADTRLCLKTLFGGLLGLFEWLIVVFARRIALIRLGSAASIRSKIHGAANPSEFSDRT
jgi:hypothetical protein